MEVKYHPLVQRDLIDALRYYDAISLRLGSRFFAEVRSIIRQAAVNPGRFHLADRGFRRANLRQFPYHILYELRGEVLQVMHIRHNKRHPDYRLDRT